MIHCCNSLVTRLVKLALLESIIIKKKKRTKNPKSGTFCLK
jgi:hypothetical protein